MHVRGTTGSSRPRRRATLAVGAACALTIVALATIVINGIGDSTAPPGMARTAQFEETPEVEEIGMLLDGIPQSGNALGSPDAPVTLLFFGDLECPTARGFALEALPDIIRRWVRPGTVRIEFLSMRSVSEPEAFGEQQAAALAAGMQNKLWYFLELFYHEQGSERSGYVTEGFLASLARQVSGLNRAQWGEARGDPGLLLQVTREEQFAQAKGFTGTPSFLIGRTGSTPLYKLGETASLAEINQLVQRSL